MGYLSFRKSISAVDVLLQADKAYCSLTKKAAFGAQHNRQTGTFRLYRAGRRVRHDSFSPVGEKPSENYRAVKQVWQLAGDDIQTATMILPR